MSSLSPAPAPASARATWLFCAAVFVSAFLLFQVQPLISKAILPWFGGTPSVWTTCMLFFQVVLFGGYAYAHLVSARLPVRVQGGLHVILLALALATLGILPMSHWKPSGDESPVLRIVQLLGVTVGLPYFILSTTGPLLQRWYSLLYPERSPYWLYSLSNAGSLLALLSYPFVFEPLARMSEQGWMWQLGFWVFAGLCVTCVLHLRKVRAPVSNPTTESLAVSQPPTIGQYALWFILAMSASAMLLATTNQVCQDVAVVPFLWVAPLSLYLLSFILCFDSDRWYRRDLWAPACTLLIVGVCWVQVYGQRAFLPLQVSVYFGALFAMCMVCHGELARMRPSAQHLTAFYLTMSAGGAGGGLFVALLAPLVFPDYWEFHVCLAAGTIIGIVTFYHGFGWIGPDVRPPVAFTLLAALLLAVVGVVFADRLNEHSASLAVVRNFYGVLKADLEVRGGEEVKSLRNGRILHGLQYTQAGWESIPTTYYAETSGAGLAARLLQERGRPMKLGCVGLGVGTMAAYGREGDIVRFYEINAADVQMAQEQFTYLERSPAEVEIALGDARLSMESEPPQQFDLLVLDAFSGDAIPTHLLTREAMEHMLGHMRPDGIIAVHISNLHFDLRPVVAALADEFQLASVLIDDRGKAKPGDLSSRWVLLATDPDVLQHASLANAVTDAPARRVLWTDDFSNLFNVLR
ncbi:MAG: fused MFS/spermidine synthase [Planctomycetaceae bacterium]|nr:fused MFS/spermidine synthase [Planctomycetaceae bacterium]